MKKTSDEESEEDASILQIVGATTRRHKHTPSVGSAVGTIAEGEEDESESLVKEKTGPLAQISNAAEKKEDVMADEPATQEALQAVGLATEEKKKDENEDGDESADEGDDTASVVTAIRDDAEEAENEG